MKPLHSALGVLIVIASLGFTLLSVQGTHAQAASTARVCENGRVYLKAKGVTCARARDVVRVAFDKYDPDHDGSGRGPVLVGKMKCRFPAYYGVVDCKHRVYPRRKWVYYATE